MVNPKMFFYFYDYSKKKDLNLNSRSVTMFTMNVNWWQVSLTNLENLLFPADPKAAVGVSFPHLTDVESIFICIALYQKGMLEPQLDAVHPLPPPP